MVARTKAELAQDVATLDDNGANTVAEVRQVLTNIVDSLALATSVPTLRTPAEIVQAINAELGGVGWQQGGGGMVTGITLAQAIAAVLIDGTAVNGIELTRDDSSRTSVTIGLRRIVSTAAFVGWHTTRAPTASWFTSSGTNYDAPIEGTVDHGVVVPDVDTGGGFVAGYLVFAVPTTSGYPSNVYTNGFRQAGAAFTDEGTLIHNGTNFTIGVSANPLAPAFAGQTVTWDF